MNKEIHKQRPSVRQVLQQLGDTQTDIANTDNQTCPYLSISRFFRSEGMYLRAIDALILGRDYYAGVGNSLRELASLQLEKAVLHQKAGFPQDTHRLLLSIDKSLVSEDEYYGLLGSCLKTLAGKTADKQAQKMLLEQSAEAYAIAMSGTASVTTKNYWHAINICLLHMLLGNQSGFLSVYHDLYSFLAAQSQGHQADPWIDATYAELLFLGLISGQPLVDEATVANQYANIAHRQNAFVMHSLQNNLQFISTLIDPAVALPNWQAWFPAAHIVVCRETLDPQDLVTHLEIAIGDKPVSTISLVMLHGEQPGMHPDKLMQKFNVPVECHELSLCERTTDNSDNQHIWFLHHAEMQLTPALTQYLLKARDGLAKYLARHQFNAQVHELGASTLPRSSDQQTEPQKETGTELNSHLKTVVVADVCGYSKFSERQIHAYYSQLLARIKTSLTPFAADIEQQQTWGDSLIFVFDSTSSGIHAALTIMDCLTDLNQSGKLVDMGLPENVQMRMAIETAPLTKVFDPLEQRYAYTGTFVTHAARIEPITKIGEVYCGLGCAMHGMAEGIEGVDFQYMGIAQLAKNYRREQVFRVFRS